jgi:hypothetical protein
MKSRTSIVLRQEPALKPRHGSPDLAEDVWLTLPSMVHFLVFAAIKVRRARSTCFAPKSSYEMGHNVVDPNQRAGTPGQCGCE